MQTNATLISAAADPAIAVVHQTLAQNSSGQRILKGELVNQGSKIVNIPHVIVTCYNSAGKLVWVTDAYVPHALLPNIAQPFSVEMRNDLPNNVDNYRVTVNYYIINRV